ncbi:MAG: hypothetical protein M3Y72_06110 [Acidobacteriota bacterium]|nr:hypothetical protein [Acidobacteriota bacterium]MDQ2840603.1 hypothetical protein [Acidobacteriota bacterium]
MIIFLTFSVIVVTLVFQGLTLPQIIRFLHLAGSTDSNAEENEARKTILEAALAYLRASRDKGDQELADVCDHLIVHYHHRLEEILSRDSRKGQGTPARLVRYREVSQKVIEVERETAIRLRNDMTPFSVH